jgi:Trypsin
MTTVEHVGSPGDSGGPMLNSNGKIVAVNSAGCGTCTSPNPADSQDRPANAIAHRGFIGRLNATYGNKVLCTTCEKIAIGTTASIHFMQALNGGGSSVNTNPTTVVGGHEMFRVVPLGWTSITGINIYGFQTDSGNWLMAANGGNAAVVADSIQSGPWEAFFYLNGPNGTFNLQTFEPRFVDGAYRRFFVAAEEGAVRAVNANRASAGSWETFQKLGILVADPD